MMQRIVAVIGLTLFASGLFGLLVEPSPAYAKSDIVAVADNDEENTTADNDDEGEASNKCTASFLTFPAWYQGVIDESTCELKLPNGADTQSTLGGFIWRIVLNVINIVLQIIGYASLGYIIYGGFKYLASSGSADKVTAARKTIQNAVIGLILSIFSVVIVTFIAGRIGS